MNSNSKKKTNPHSIARIVAFQALYQEELNPTGLESNLEGLLNDYCEESQTILSSDVRSLVVKFARRLFDGVVDRRMEIDRLLNDALNKRTLKHTAVVDRNILRVATYEMKFIKTAKAIVISEAMELGKKFGDRGSRAFLNGVLDQVDKIQITKPTSFTIISEQPEEKNSSDSTNRSNE